MAQKSLGPPPGSQEIPIGPPAGSHELPTDPNSLSAQASARHDQMTKPAEQSSAGTRFLQGAGLPSSLKEIQAMGNKPWYEHLIGPVVPMAQGVSNLIGEHVDQAAQAADAAHRGEWGNYLKHSLGTAVPLIGPPAAEGNIAGAMGRGATLASMVFPEATFGTAGKVLQKIPYVRKVIPKGFEVTPAGGTPTAPPTANETLVNTPIEGLPNIPGAGRQPRPAVGTPVRPPFNPELDIPAPSAQAIPKGARPAVGNPAAAAKTEIKTQAELAPDTVYSGPPVDTDAVFGDAVKQPLIQPRRVRAKGEQVVTEGPPAADETFLTPDLAKKGKVLQEFVTNEKTGKVSGKHIEVVHVDSNTGMATVRTQDTSGLVTTKVYPIREFSLKNMGKPAPTGGASSTFARDAWYDTPEGQAAMAPPPGFDRLGQSTVTGGWGTGSKVGAPLPPPDPAGMAALQNFFLKGKP